MERLNTIKELINQGDVAASHPAARRIYCITDSPGRDEAFYLRGNAYRKQGNWQQALNNYQYAIDLNPDSPARASLSNGNGYPELLQQGYVQSITYKSNVNYGKNQRSNRSGHRTLQRLQPVRGSVSAAM